MLFRAGIMRKPCLKFILAHAKAFKLRQIPQRNIVGNNFALVSRIHALNSSSGQASGSGAESLFLVVSLIKQSQPMSLLRWRACTNRQAASASRCNNWHQEPCFGALRMKRLGFDFKKVLGYVAEEQLTHVQ
jgi:hypothetical protein